MGNASPTSDTASDGNTRFPSPPDPRAQEPSFRQLRLLRRSARTQPANALLTQTNAVIFR